MSINERTMQGLSFGEFFLKLCSLPASLRDVNKLSDIFPLTISQKIYVDSKRIVCFCLDEWTGHVLVEHSADDVKKILSFFRDSFRHLRDITPWWVDNGAVLRVFSEYETAIANGKLPKWQWPWASPISDNIPLTEGKRKEIIIRVAGAKAAYIQAIEEIQQDEYMIYDDSGDYQRVLAWADAYYGDGSPLQLAFQKADKLSCRLDVTRLGEAYPSPHTDEWLSAFNRIWPEKQRVFLEHSRQSGRKILLCFVSNEAVLSKGVAVFDDLHAILRTALICQSLSIWWLVDKGLETLMGYMESSCSDKYHELMEIVQAEQFCMYDDKSSLEATLVECDAYYGTPSPSATEHAKNGMPVVWQDCSHTLSSANLNDKKGIGLSLQFIKGCWVGDEYYFPGWRQNGIFKIKHGSEEAHYVQQFPVMGKNWRHLFLAVFSYESWLFFVPTNYHAIMAWNQNDGTWQSFELDSAYAWHKYVWFTDAFRVGDDIWLKPCNYGAIVRFDLSRRETTYYTGWEKEIKAAGPDDNGLYIGAATLAGRKMWMAARGSGHLICFSVDDLTSKTYELSEFGTGIASLTFDGADLWIYAKTGDLLRWNPDHGVKQCFDKILHKSERLGGLICHSNKVWLFANLQDSYSCYDLESGELSYQEHYLPERERASLGYAQLSCDEKHIYITPNFGKLTIKFNPIDMSVKTWNIRLSHKDERRFSMEAFNEYYEPIGASAFIDMYEVVLFLECYRQKDNSFMESVGEKIYGLVCR